MDSTIDHYKSHMDECPICYKEYGRQKDGNFLCMDGKVNSDFAEKCAHYICSECCVLLSKQNSVTCPLCREDWTEWIQTHYDEDEDEDEDEEEEDTTEQSLESTA